jgi:hypothetical protein
LAGFASKTFARQAFWRVVRRHDRIAAEQRAACHQSLVRILGIDEVRAIGVASIEPRVFDPVLEDRDFATRIGSTPRHAARISIGAWRACLRLG